MITIKIHDNSLKLIDLIILMLLTVSSMVSFITCAINETIVEGYQYIYILPICFIIFNIFLYIRIVKFNNIGKVTVLIFTFIQWLRLVILPLVGCSSGYFSQYGRFVDFNSANVAVVMMAYEAIITSIFAFIIFETSIKMHLEKKSNKTFKLYGSKKIYWIFILIAFTLFLGTGANKFHFFVLKLSDERVSTTLGNAGNALDAIIDYGLIILMVVILYYCYTHYNNKHNKKFFYIALSISLLRMCLLSSEGRMSQIYLLGIFLLLLPNLFPQHKKTIYKCIILISALVLGLMTIYKTFYAFLYDSYLDAIKANSMNLKDVSSQIDIYFYGLKTVARNITYTNASDLNVFQSILDILKNTFGIHYAFRNQFSTVEFYNLYLYSGSETSGHLFSSLAYGILYFGKIFAPMVSCFNVFLAFQFEKLLSKINYLDIYYIVALVFTRFSLSIFSNFPQTWNVVSRTIIISFFVIFGSKLLKK